VGRDPNAGLRTAGTVAIWLWIVITVLPILVVLACIGLCLFGGILGSGEDPSVTPTAS
jgi:hypothetical protein